MAHRPNRLPVAPPPLRHRVHSPTRAGQESALERVRRIARAHRLQEAPFDPEKRGTWRGSSRDLVVNARHRQNPEGHLTAEQLLDGTYLGGVLDTALSTDHSQSDIKPGDWLVGWDREDDRILVIAVIGAYTKPDEKEAIEIATDWALEDKLLSRARRPDYVVQVEEGRSALRARFEDLQQGQLFEIDNPSEATSISWGSVSPRRDGDWWGSNYTQGSDYSGSSVERSNYKALKEMCQELSAEHGDFWVDAYGGHGTYGIFFNVYSTPDEIVEVLNGLEDYPSVDDDALSHQEIEDQAENWDSWAKADYRRELEKAFGGDASEMTDEQLWDSFQEAAEAADVYWESQSGTGDYHIDIGRIVKKMAEPPEGFVPGE